MSLSPFYSAPLQADQHIALNYDDFIDGMRCARYDTKLEKFHTVCEYFTRLHDLHGKPAVQELIEHFMHGSEGHRYLLPNTARFRENLPTAARSMFDEMVKERNASSAEEHKKTSGRHRDVVRGVHMFCAGVGAFAGAAVTHQGFQNYATTPPATALVTPHRKAVLSDEQYRAITHSVLNPPYEETEKPTQETLSKDIVAPESTRAPAWLYALHALCGAAAGYTAARLTFQSADDKEPKTVEGEMLANIINTMDGAFKHALRSKNLSTQYL